MDKRNAQVLLAHQLRYQLRKTARQAAKAGRREEAIAALVRLKRMKGGLE